MERRVVLAVVLMLATVVVVNLLFPPAPPRRPPAETAPDTPAAPAETPPPVRPTLPEPSPEPAAAETVHVRTPLFRLAFVSRGAALVAGELQRYASLAPEAEGQPVQLVRPDAPLLGARWVVGRDTLDLSDATFTSSTRAIELPEGSAPDTLEMAYRHPSGEFGVDVAYAFSPDRYVVEVRGRMRTGAGGWWALDLGAGLPNSEADREENLKSLALVVNGPRGIENRRFEQIDAGQTFAFDGPHWWAAVRDKYFLIAVIAPTDAQRLGGAAARATGRPYEALVTATVPVARDGTFGYDLYLGPQDAPRLARIGRDLQDVNPYGWAFLRPIIRPLARGIIALLLWARDALGVNYGWILILFGFAVRAVLFPLYQSTMRSQMRMAEVQPLFQEIQSKYRSDPQRLQQEMMKIYKEKGMTPFTPLTSGCLPMLLPFPFLIALFFVFRDTIEFRGAGFLWMPDLARPDPLYIIPVLMGLSMFALSWLGQRAVPQTNPQMKMVMYVMPVMLTIFFLALPAGLNVYYFAMNVASIPQQLYLNRERRRMAAARETSS